jgi:hypothetical protein
MKNERRRKRRKTNKKMNITNGRKCSVLMKLESTKKMTRNTKISFNNS